LRSLIKIGIFKNPGFDTYIYAILGIAGIEGVLHQIQLVDSLEGAVQIGHLKCIGEYGQLIDILHQQFVFRT